MPSRPTRRVARVLTLGLRTGAHVTRYTMYRSLAQSVPRFLGVGPVRALSISGSRPLIEALGVDAEQVDEAAYPEHDLLDLSAIPGSRYDLVVSDQVLEHVHGDPQRAVSESLRVARPGGLVIHTTCFMNPVHRHPVDLWRFTPEALAWLLRDADVVQADGWGNRRAVVLLDSPVRGMPVPHARWHPLHRLATRNDPAWPIVTWVVARKRTGTSL